MATSGRYQDSLHTIETEWSIGDVMNACEVIEAIEAAEAGAKPRKPAREKRGRA